MSKIPAFTVENILEAYAQELYDALPLREKLERVLSGLVRPGWVVSFEITDTEVSYIGNRSFNSKHKAISNEILIVLCRDTVMKEFEGADFDHEYNRSHPNTYRWIANYHE